MREILQHFAKVGKKSKLCLYTLQGTVQPLDSLKQHCLTIGQLDKAQSDRWTVEHSADQPSDSLTQH